MKFLIPILLLSIATLCASVERIGIFVGNNQGLITEKDLKYADNDARRMAAQFQESKNVDGNNIFLLENASSDQLFNTLQNVGRQVSLLKDQGIQSLLLFYFSGHGSVDDLHIKGEHLNKTDLFTRIEMVGADVKVLIVDACESGKLLRKKGGLIVDAIKVVQVDSLKSKGTVVFTSSGVDEISLESEEYKGAVFTHHLINGLQGLADYNNDREIGLWEAFNYAQTSTHADNIIRQASQQNPSFDFDVVGESDISLAQLNDSYAEVVFNGFSAVPVRIYKSQTMELYSRVLLPGKQQVRFRLPTGSYVVAIDRGNYSEAARIDLTWSNQAQVVPSDFKSYPITLFAAKGGSHYLLAPYGIQVSVGGADPTNSHVHQFGVASPLYHYSLSGVLRTNRFTHRITVGYGSDQLQSPLVTLDRQFLSLGYGLSQSLYTVRYGDLLIGGRLSYVHLLQETYDARFDEINVSNVNQRTNSQAWILQGGIPLEWDLYLPFGLWATVGYTVSASLFKEYAGEYAVTFNGAPMVSLGVMF
ncbi:MAG: caspase family protein [Fibrobacterales bacterium]